MAKFRVTYHTTGGPFSHEAEADTAEAAAEAAEKALKGGQVRLNVNDILILIDADKVAAISVEAAKGGTGLGIGLLKR